MEQENITDDLFDVEIDQKAKSLLADIARWARIIAITSFASYGLTLLYSFVAVPEVQSGLTGSAARISQIAIVLIFVTIGTILNLFLLRFGTDVKAAIDTSNQAKLESGFNSFRIYWKIAGILLIIVLSFVVLAVLLGIVGNRYT